MIIDVRQRSTEQPANEYWPVWQWWFTMVATAAIATALSFSRQPDLPDGFGFVLLATVCVFTSWDWYLKRRKQYELRIILGRVWPVTYLTPMLTLYAVGVLTDWYVSVGSTIFYTLLFGGATGAILALITRRYLERGRRSWMSVNVAIGMLTVTAALFIHRSVVEVANELIAYLVAAGITAVAWGILPGLILSRLLRTIPYDTWHEIQRQIHIPPSRFARWCERWGMLLSLVLLMLTVLRPALRTCGWLDTSIGRSSCVAQLKLPRGYPEAVAWSSSAALVATVSLDGVQLFQLDDGQTILDLQQSKMGDLPFKVSIAPNGKLIAFSFIQDEGSTAEVWSSTGERLLETSTTDDRSVAFSADSRFMVTGATVWNMESNQREHVFAPETRIHNFSPDGTLVATSTWVDEKAAVQIWRTANWTQTATMIGFNDSLHDIDFSPDNRYIPAAGYRNQVEVRQVMDGSAVWSEPQYLEAITIAWSPDGSALAVAGGEIGQGRVWLLRPEDGAIQRTWLTATDRNEQVVWSPDGTKLVTNGPYGWLRTWRIK